MHSHADVDVFYVKHVYIQYNATSVMFFFVPNCVSARYFFATAFLLLLDLDRFKTCKLHSLHVIFK